MAAQLTPFTLHVDVNPRATVRTGEVHATHLLEREKLNSIKAKL
jgi:hypothetical protein